jgi:hypothetical protein
MIGAIMIKTQLIRVLLVAAFVTPAIYAKFIKRDAMPLPSVSVLGPTNSVLRGEPSRPPKKPTATPPAAPQNHLENGWTLELPKKP